MPCRCVTCELKRLTGRLEDYRLWRKSEMAIKWNITQKATEARGHMEAISRAYDKLNDQARGHRSDVEGLATQVHDMQSDLEAAANVMGNGGEHSEEAGKPADTFQG